MTLHETGNTTAYNLRIKKKILLYSKEEERSRQNEGVYVINQCILLIINRESKG